MSNILKGKKFSIITLGCKVNKYESDAMQEDLLSAGCINISKAEKNSSQDESASPVSENDADEKVSADICIVNTCSVTNIADQKSRQMLHKMKRQNKDAVVVATGCYVQAAADKLLADEAVDIVIGNNRKIDIVRILTEYFEGKDVKDNVIDINHDDTYENLKVSAPSNTSRAYIKIQDGCNLFCTYCIIPYVRGRIRSKKVNDIINEMNTLADNGVREIVLTGIDISSYNDNGTDFCEMLHMVSQNVKKVDRIRLGSLEPRIITERFIEIMKSDERFCPHFHLSLQSVCDNTLKRMNRHYTVQIVKDKVKLLRDNFDRPALTADLIAGFAGETEEDFNTTLDNLAELKLYETHVFKFSRRKGTVADKMPDQVPEPVKAERSEKMIRLENINQSSYEKQFKGETVNVLVEEMISKNGKRFFRGHTERYILVDIPVDDIIEKSDQKNGFEKNFINQIIQTKL